MNILKFIVSFFSKTFSKRTATLVTLIVLVVSFFVISTLAQFGPKPEKAEQPDTGVTVFAERVDLIDLKLTVKSQGEVQPAHQIILSPRVSGRINSVSEDFEAGGFIQKGQLLVQLSDASKALQVIRARAAVASAEANLTRIQAEAELTRQEIDDFGFKNVGPLALREPQLAEAQAALDGAKAQLQETELALSYTKIYAPFSGRVLSTSVDEGQYVGVGQRLGVVFSSSAVEVALPLTDYDMGQLGLPFAFAATPDNPGADVVFQATVAGQPREWYGKIVRTAAAVNSRTRLINAIAEVEDPFGAGADDGVPMAPGLFVNANVVGATAEGVFSAPRSALRGSETIYLGNIETKKMEIANVDVVHSDENGVYFRNREGSARQAKLNDLAVISPVQAVFDGMKINVIERLPDGTLVSLTKEPEAEEDKDSKKDKRRNRRRR